MIRSNLDGEVASVAKVMGRSSSGNPSAVGAAVIAGLAIATQVAGKAARDAIFLDHFPITSLPVVLIAASLLSIVLALGMGRAMVRLAPGWLVPTLHAVSAVALVGEWWLLPDAGGAVSVAIYIHQVAIGALLVSGVWSVIAECVDPSTARAAMSTVGRGATVGGIVGAVIAERTGAMVGARDLLLVLALLQLGAIVPLWWLGHAARSPVGGRASAPPLAETLRSLTRPGLVRLLAVMVVVVTVTTGLLDYVFKAHAAASYQGDDLLRFLAFFHGSVGVATVFVQWALGRKALNNLGLGGTISSLPAVTAAATAVALAAPGLGTVVAARGAEQVLRNSLYRQAYEILFTPLPVREKRATKTVVDVGVERIGDALGGAVIAALVAAGVGSSTGFLAGAAGLGAIGVWVASWVQRAYVGALERSLLARAVELELDQVEDRTSRAALLVTMSKLPVRRMAAVEAAPAPDAAERPIRVAVDAAAQRVAELRSGDVARVRGVLVTGPLSRGEVSFAIALLAWDEIAPEVTEALQRVAARSVGQLADALLDADEEFAVRRRLPRVIAAAGGERARAALVAGLDDPRLEVRIRCAGELAVLREREADFAVDAERVFRAATRELSGDGRAWRGHRLDGGFAPRGDSTVSLSGEVPRDRVDPRLEHVFTMFMLVLPVEPIRIAFQGLHTTDRGLRGTALEYLDQVLPEEVHARLRPILDADGYPARRGRPPKQVEEELLASNAAIRKHLIAERTEGEGRPS